MTTLGAIGKTIRIAPISGAWAGHSGTGDITGITEIPEGVPKRARVSLHSPKGAVIHRTYSASDGTYAFYGLAAGRYTIVIDDETGTYRSKVIHVDVA